jgi:hypothetical protein
MDYENGAELHQGEGAAIYGRIASHGHAQLRIRSDDPWPNIRE